MEQVNPEENYQNLWRKIYGAKSGGSFYALPNIEETLSESMLDVSVRPERKFQATLASPLEEPEEEDKENHGPSPSRIPKLNRGPSHKNSNSNAKIIDNG